MSRFQRCAAVSLIWLVCAADPAVAQQLNSQEQAAALSLAARGKYKEQRFSVCAAMYREAFGMDRKQIGYLYSAALCEQKAGNHTAAQRDYETVLSLSMPEDPLAVKARNHLQEVRAAQIAAHRAEAEKRRQQRLANEVAAKAARDKAAAAQRTNKPAAIANTALAADPAWHKPAGWASVALGIVAVGVGGWVLVDGMSDVDDLKTKLAKDPKSGKIEVIARADALAEQDAANSKQRMGAGVLAVGVAVAATGAWLLQPSSPPKNGQQRSTLAPLIGARGLVWTTSF